MKQASLKKVSSIIVFINTNIISLYLQFTEVTTVSIIVTKISGCNRFGFILEIVGNVSICQK